MKLRPFVLLLCVVFVPPVFGADDYELGPDSKPQEGVPKGELVKFEFESAKIFPGTTRSVTVYIPRQYDATKPACLYVNQDAVQWNAPVVFDNLIARGEMPVTIGVFITPGKVRAADPEHALDRFNRSVEYDGQGDAYVRFLLEELLPEVEKKTAADGRPIKLSTAAADRAIGGSSSGAICAFTAAWERPQSFSRVFSAIGTYVGLRGGDRYPTLIRKYEPKALRVFLQDGSNDNNHYGGDWWMANQTMERALAFAGYEVQHAWGEGGHSGKQGSSVFPDAMRWLWKDWPQPVKTGETKNEMLNAILIPGEGWQLVGEGYRSSEGIAANAKGEIFFADIGGNKTFRVGADGAVSVVLEDSKKVTGQAFGPDGRLYTVATATQQVIAYDADGKAAVIADGFTGNDLTVAHNGNVYVTNPPANNSNDPSKLWLIKPTGEKLVVDTAGPRYANGVTVSPDQTLLYVSDYRSHWIYSYQIVPDGTLRFRQRFYWLHEPDASDESAADGVEVDRDGRLYVATRLGVQVCDQAGRVNVIIPTPNRRLSNLCFGGENFDTLFATCGDKVFKRKLRVRGAPGFEPPFKPAVPRL